MDTMETGPDGAQVLGVNEGTDSSLRVAATLQEGGDDDLPYEEKSPQF
jgi:hypothetical protein